MAKRKLYALAIILLFQQTIYGNIFDYIEKNQIYNDPIWHSLLHLKNNEPQINTPTFLLSYKNFNPKNELYATVSNFLNNKKSICKYPARYYWLEEKLSHMKFSLPKKECNEFNTYIHKTNPQSIDIVFSSEDIKNPSSMMGHVFFKLNGIEDNQTRQNTVSFYTVIDTVNIPWLVIKSTMIGMKGYFILSPYKQQVHNNLYNENRSIWEYRLNLSQKQINLITYHFWELKDIDIKYLFTGFNCATIVDNILKLGSLQYSQSTDLWITPKDVIKKINTSNLVKYSKLRPTIEWELYMFNDIFDESKLNYLMSLVNSNRVQNINTVNLTDLEKSFILVYVKYLYVIEKSISYDYYLKIHTQIDSLNLKDIEIINAKNPIDSVNDSQLTLGYNYTDSYTTLQFLPASSTLYDNHKGTFSEKTLEIGKIKLKLKNKKISIDNFTLYNMESIIPRKKPMNAISKSFIFAYKQDYIQTEKSLEHLLEIKGGLGVSYLVHEDLIVYSFLNLKINSYKKQLDPFISFIVGTNIYEIFNNKSVIQFEHFQNIETNKNYNSISINQSIFIKKDYRFDINYKSIQENDFSNEILNFNLTFYL